jgi:thioredoxin 1
MVSLAWSADDERFAAGENNRGAAKEYLQMPFDSTYHEEEPTREEVDRSAGPLLLEFGANWCGHCQALSSTVEALLTAHPQVRHVRVADARGKHLGRSFRVKLWPSLIFLRDGKVVAHLVRPSSDEARQALERLVANGA